jgi:hypothetical protein
MVCTSCGIVGADARPNWKEEPPQGGTLPGPVVDNAANPRSDLTVDVTGL